MRASESTIKPLAVSAGVSFGRASTRRSLVGKVIMLLSERPRASGDKKRGTGDCRRGDSGPK
jgi:hypothetical protein